MARQDSLKTSSRLIQIAAAIVIIFALRYAQEVLVPVALAVLFAFLLAPLVHRLERTKLPRVPAVLLVVLLAFSVLTGIGLIVARQVSDLTEHLPEYSAKISEGIQHFRGRKPGMISKISQTAHHLASEVASSQPATRPAAATQTANAGTSGATGNGVGTMASAMGVDGGAAGAAPPPPEDKIVPVRIVPSTPPAVEMIKATFGPVLSLLATAFIVVVLCIFMLLAREDLRDRVIRLVGSGNLDVTTQAMDDAAQRVSKYLLFQAITNGAYGCVVAAGLWLIGVPGSFLWGLIAALLRFIPYVGPWLGAAGPILLAFVTRGPHRGFAAIGMWVGLEVVVSSFVEPVLYGSRTGVSSIAILVAAVFWAWLWGGVGLLLATPLTVLLVVVGKYVPQLEFLAVLLGDEPVFDPPTRYYQRLLAADQEEATELVEQYLKEMSLEQVYESVMIPALGLAHRDRFRGRLDGERADFVRQAMKEEIRDLGERPPPPEPIAPSAGAEATAAAATITPTTNVEAALSNAERKEAQPEQAERAAVQRARIEGADSVQIVCLPARDEADELAGMMFAQVLERNGFKAEAVSASALASEMVGIVGKLKADIVVVSALPPSAITHARYLCKRLHQAFPEVVLVVGLWTSRADLKEAKEKVTCTGRDAVVATFTDGVTEMEQLVHPLLLSRGGAAPVTPAAPEPAKPMHPTAREQQAQERERRVAEVNRELSPSKVGAAAEQRDDKKNEGRWKQEPPPPQPTGVADRT